MNKIFCCGLVSLLIVCIFSLEGAVESERVPVTKPRVPSTVLNDPVQAQTSSANKEYQGSGLCIIPGGVCK